VFVSSRGSTALVNPGLLFDFRQSHPLTCTHSVGFLWTSDRPVAETSTWQHTTNTWLRCPCPRRHSKRNFNKRKAVDRLPLGQAFKTLTLVFFETQNIITEKQQAAGNEQMRECQK